MSMTSSRSNDIELAPPELGTYLVEGIRGYIECIEGIEGIEDIEDIEGIEGI